MARYVDVEALLSKLPDDLPYKASVKRVLMQAPTADVVPRSEAERDIDDLLRYIILNEDISLVCKMENGEQNEEYFKGKLAAFKQVRGYIKTELKKKYTEENK